jgi:hypothetical protein
MRPLCKKVLHSFQTRSLCAVGDILGAADIINDMTEESRGDVIDAVCELARARYVSIDKEKVLVSLDDKGAAFLQKLNNDTAV